MEVPEKYGSPNKKTSLHETGAGDRPAIPEWD